MVSKEAFTKRVGQNIKRIREAKGMSQEEVADRAEMYRTYVGHIENARYLPSSYVIYKLAKALNVSIDEIIFQ